MTVPFVPLELCFNHGDFIKDTFSIDQFLQDHRKKANLERMRDDLGLYLKILRSSMIELINQDYADFVNLSSNLIALDRSILTIQEPLEKLEVEVFETKLVLDSTISDIKKLIEKKQSLIERKKSLKSFSKTQDIASKLDRLVSRENLDTVLLERAVMEYIWLKCHSNRCLFHLTDEHRKLNDKICDAIMSHLRRTFLEAVKKGEEQLDTLKICLNLFVTLGKRDTAESLVQQHIVLPVIDNLINEDSLISDPRGLEGLYDRVILFVDDSLKYLFQLTRQTDFAPSIKGFNFMCNSIWPVVEQCLELRLKSIYAPGNPEIFHQRYTETMAFLNEFEKRCGNEVSVKELRSQPQYQAFLQKWNLSVYFQLRFQEIASQLETILMDSEKFSVIVSTSGKPFLNATNVVWVCINQCWSSHIFIVELAHRFWKLSLQILSRYCSWIKAVLKKTPILSMNLTRQQFLIYCHSDTEYLIQTLPELLKLVKSKLVNRISDQIWVSAQNCILDIENQLKSCLIDISKSVIDDVASSSLLHVRSVSDTPRLFRRTNRDVPKQPCSYVAAILGPPLSFHQKYPEHSALWLSQIFSIITSQYYSCVEDVIKSVQKTEESLRRLKQIRERSFTESRSSGGDDDKIRQQLLIDVSTYCDAIENLGLNKSTIEKLSELLEMVKAETVQSKPKSTK